MQKSVTKIRSKFSCEIVLEFQKENFPGFKRATTSGQVMPVFAYSYNKSRLSMGIFFKRYSLVSEAL